MLLTFVYCVCSCHGLEASILDDAGVCDLIVNIHLFIMYSLTFNSL